MIVVQVVERCRMFLEIVKCLVLYVKAVLWIANRTQKLVLACEKQKKFRAKFNFLHLVEKNIQSLFLQVLTKKLVICLSRIFFSQFWAKCSSCRKCRRVVMKLAACCCVVICCYVLCSKDFFCFSAYIRHSGITLRSWLQYSYEFIKQIWGT